jgi:transposase
LDPLIARTIASAYRAPAVMRCLEEQIRLLERAILAKGRLRKEFHGLKTVSGIGDVLALTIALETGDVHRFASVRQVRFLRAHGG